MPNWCTNDLTLSNDDTAKVDALEELLKKLDSDEKPENGVLQYLVPMPKEEEENWYDWHVNHWGTKWDIYPQQWSREGNTIWMIFDSAWSPPLVAYETLTQQGWEVDALYEECGMGFVGRFSEGEDEFYEYDFDDEDWRDEIPEDLIEFAGLDYNYDSWKESREENGE